MKISPLSHFASFLLATALATQAGSLTLSLTQVRPQGGTVYVALFAGPEGFPDGPQRLRSLQLQPPAAQIDTSYRDLPPGDYAIAVFQDLNHNGKPDQNFFGKPKEPIGFSRNLRPKFGPPKFKNAAISVSEGNTSVQIQMVTL